MARFELPPGITPQQLDDVFERIIKLSPEREHAVRLRLTGLTHQEVVDKINADRKEGPYVHVMWAKRSCDRAKDKLYEASQKRINSLNDDAEETSLRLAEDDVHRQRDPLAKLSFLGQHDPLLELTDKIWMALDDTAAKEKRRLHSEATTEDTNHD